MELYVLVIRMNGVNEKVSVAKEEQILLDRVERWLPELRAGRVTLQDFGYKKGVTSEDGHRTYEIFRTVMAKR